MQISRYPPSLFFSSVRKYETTEHVLRAADEMVLTALLLFLNTTGWMETLQRGLPTVALPSPTGALGVLSTSPQEPQTKALKSNRRPISPRELFPLEDLWERPPHLLFTPSFYFFVLYSSLPPSDGDKHAYAMQLTLTAFHENTSSLNYYYY